MNYWLFKSEPDCYSIDDLQKDETEHWDGIRNYQARNMLRDDVKKGDQVLFYHSSCAVPAVVGLSEVVKEGYPDHTAFDPKSEHPDPKSHPENPRWFMVDIKFKEKFNTPVPLSQIKDMSEFSGMKLVQRGNRLSIMPLDKEHFELLCQIAHA
jgi:predicted RNA-binding protein with PUA-like domain